MKHFSDARAAARTALSAAPLQNRLLKATLIWDLRGRLRVMFEPTQPQDAPALKTDLNAALSAAAEGFWSGECWAWTPDTEPAAKRVYEQARKEATVVSPGPPEISELDRHLSKGAWFGRPMKAPWPLNDQTPPIIAFFSFKGGVGRTTALSSLAIQLARAKKRVCIVDLDLEAPGVGSLFAPQAGQASYGVLDYFLDRPVHAGAFALGDYYVDYDDAAVLDNGPPISVVPAGALDQQYLEKLARVDYERLLDPESNQESLLVRLLKEIKADRQPHYVLIDSRAGLHDVGGLALNGVAHLDVLFGLDNEQSWAGLELVLDHLGRRRIEQGERQQDCALVYAMAPSSTSPERATRLSEFTDRSFAIFSKCFYDAEPMGGWPNPLPPEVWPVPSVEAPDEPHFPIPIGFRAELQQARLLSDMAPQLIEGDYKLFLDWLLSRIGRTAP
jgi:cellulose biosynthesis protein BcsQ